MNRHICLLLAAVTLGIAVAAQPRLTILHTNDTHSAVEPDAKTDLGGVLRRKAIVDSVRAAEPAMLLIDAGDAVQGSLYFMLFGGEVESRLMNAQGYDMAILGNHEFDNGMERLATNIRALDAEMLSSNYDFTGTPLEGLFLPYSIRQVGDRKIAFIALNIDPEGLIDGSNTAGMRYHDAISSANSLAHLLKTKEGADMVIAVTHLGYDSAATSGSEVNDENLARQSSDIDIIIGGHSHTLIEPGSAMSRIPNAQGDTVLVTQTGSKGRYIGQIDIDLATLRPDYRLIEVNSRLDDRADPQLKTMIDGYKGMVDSIAAIPVGRSKRELPGGSDALLNLASDIVMARALATVPADMAPDFAVMNRGGIRTSLPAGVVTRGRVMDIFPFDNRLSIVRLTGRQVTDLFSCMAERPTVASLSKEAEIVYNPANHELVSTTVGGKPVDPDRDYYVATIDYLAKGNDYLTPFRSGQTVYRSSTPIYNDIMEYISAAASPVDAPDAARVHP